MLSSSLFRLPTPISFALGHMHLKQQVEIHFFASETDEALETITDHISSLKEKYGGGSKLLIRSNKDSVLTHFDSLNPLCPNRTNSSCIAKIS